MASNVATEAVQESDDLTICCVCMEVYNEGNRKPKSLSCHHTYCVTCIKVSLTTNYSAFPVALVSSLILYLFIKREWLVICPVR